MSNVNGNSLFSSICNAGDVDNDSERKTYILPLELLTSEHVVKICAPMVRYSRLPFRALVRKYGCDIAYTPMIMADSFTKSAKARDVEFTTNEGDRPLIAQFAASNAKELADAAELIKPYADGIDLNCGCPQRWAIQDKVGACLLRSPALLADMIRTTQSRISDPDFTVSIKIRIEDDLRRTVDLCQKAESAGAAWIAVHGRTVDQRATPVNEDAIGLVKTSVSIPVIANGDVTSLRDADRLHAQTGVNGVMSARGLLANPAMFAGFDHTPRQCVTDWVDIALSLGTSFDTLRRHLVSMLEPITSRSEKRVFNCLNSTTAILDYLDEHYKV